MRALAILIIVLTVAGLSPVRGAAPKDLVQTELLADVDTIQPGEPFMLGVKLKIKPKWHIYWKYPGDSGMATKVKFVAPEGYQVSELLFPIPDRFDQPGDIVGYGYHDDVMLLAKVTPPAHAKPGQPVEITANVKYLVCEDVCIPGKADVKIALKTGEAAKPANEELFAKWKELLPRAQRGGVNILRNADTGEYIAGITLDQSYKDVQWFPVPPADTAVENPQTKTQGSESKYTFKLVPDITKPQPMQFLVAYTDQTGKRRGVEFAVNLPSP